MVTLDEDPVMVLNDQESQDSSQDRERRKEVIIVKGQARPSQAEIGEHMVTHLPFRSWCVHCIRGKSVGKPHCIKCPSEDTQVPTVSLDYMFMTSGDQQGEVVGGGSG